MQDFALKPYVKLLSIKRFCYPFIHGHIHMSVGSLLNTLWFKYIEYSYIPLSWFICSLYLLIDLSTQRLVTHGRQEWKWPNCAFYHKISFTEQFPHETALSRYFCQQSAIIWYSITILLKSVMKRGACKYHIATNISWSAVKSRWNIRFDFQ